MNRKEKNGLVTICFVLSLAVCVPSQVCSESFLQPGETSIFSFSLEDGSRVFLCVGEDEEYLTFRMLRADTLIFQYPAVPDSNSWRLFEYSSYSRGVGAANMGMDINSLTFDADSVVYTLYDEYYAEDESYHDGLRMVSPRGEVDLEGVPESVTGSLIPFRFDYSSLLGTR